MTAPSEDLSATMTAIWKDNSVAFEDIEDEPMVVSEVAGVIEMAQELDEGD